MFKSFLLVLALGSASAASIIATVDCDGNITSSYNFNFATDVSFAFCQSAIGFLSYARATVGPFPPANPALPLQVEGYTQAILGGFVEASASLSGTYELTVFSQFSGEPITGGGFFLPCIRATEVGGPPGSSGFSSASFGGYSVDSGGGGNNICAFEGLASASPFTYGVAQPFEITLSAYGFNAADAGASLGGNYGYPYPQFEFWSSSGYSLSNVSYVLVEVPEPGSFAVFIVAFLLLLCAQAQPLHLPRRSQFPH